MTLHGFAVPKWGLGMEEGTLTSWLVTDGAVVTQGQEIAEIETSKIANVVEATAAGILHQVATPGDLKPVGALLGVIADAAEDEAAIAAYIAAALSAPATPQATVEDRAQAQIVTVDGATIRFLKASAARPYIGAPLVLIHGFGGSHLNWMLNQDPLAKGRDVYALDLPGHGGSSKDVGEGSLETLALTVERWLNTQHLASAHFVGHSMGAAVAATLALADPSRVMSLTAVSGVGFGSLVNRAYADAFLAAGRRKDLQAAIEMLFADPTLITRQMLDDLLAYKRTDGVFHALRALNDHALAEQSQLRLRRRLAEIRAPMLALFGAHDRLVLAPAAGEIPARIGIIDLAGHMPHLEAAAAVNAAVTDFVRQHD